MNISNFGAGIISSAAHSNLRDISAQDAENVRHSEIDGALITRSGYKRIPSDNEQIVNLFASWSHVLAVTAAGELKWELEQSILNAEADTSLFRSFVPAREGFDVSSPTRFIAHENVVYVSNANKQLKVIFENGRDPVAYPFYLPHLGAITVSWTGSGDTIYLRLQPVKTASQTGPAPSYYPIEAVGRSGLAADKVPNNAVLDIQIDESDLSSDTDIDYIDVFQTKTTAVTADAIYYFIGRIPYRAGTHRLSTTTDTDLETERTLVEPLAEPVWQIAESSNERLYLNTGKDNRIWMTYYDSGASYFRSVTDYFDVQTGGFAITGLKKLNQNVLVVYTRNRIYLVNMDPVAEQHSVVSVINSRDDRDAPIGCIAAESLVDIDGYHYFLAGNRQVYRFGGQRASWVAAPINPLLAKMPRTGPEKAVGFARGMTYCLSYPSTPTSQANDAMLLFDTERKVWWKDTLAVSDISKGRTQYEYAIIGAWPALLDFGKRDNDTLIAWLWKGNKILIPLNTLIHSVFVGVLPEDVNMDPVELSISLKTEEGEQTQELRVAAGVNYWEQYAGFNLRGRSVEVTLTGEGAMKIDRLIFNPEP